jgi:prophage antirepressor-like protein
MSNLIPFEFESHALRVNMDAAGQPWFVAADVCAALSIGNSRMALDRLDADEKGVSSIDTPGGSQEMSVVNESGLYNLVLGSRKPEAKRFKRWVTHEVLPAIRKTGTYASTASATSLASVASVATVQSVTHDRVNALLSIGEALVRVPGVKPGIAMAAVLTSIHENTGLALESLRKVLPAANEPVCSLNPTQLGELAGMSARGLNQRLQSLGFQFKNDRDEWELTESGKTWAEALPFARNGHSGYQILWNPALAQQMREVA